MNILEQIHSAGFVYNDMKLDNLLMDFNFDAKQIIENEENIFENNNVNLIDMGFATTYLDQKTGEHIKKKLVSTFNGNLIFASTN